MQFQPGHPGGPGRPKGSRNKLAESFLDVLHRDFEQHGAAAVVAMRTEKPADYVKCIASLLPQKVEVERRVADMTDEELLAILSGERARAAVVTDEDVRH